MSSNYETGHAKNVANLKEANTNVVDSYTSWSNSLVARNALLYTPLSGLVPLAMDVKNMSNPFMELPVRNTSK